MVYINSRRLFKGIIALTKLAFFCALFYGPGSLAKEINIGIGSTLAPYVLSSHDEGIEVDIIREALKAKGYTANFKYLPNLRIPMLLGNRKLDAASINAAYKIENDIGSALYASDTVITYQNYAIALKRKQFDIKSIRDLADKNILAFQNATRYLGEEYAFIVNDNSNYKETHKQYLQVKQLLGNRIDIVISDKNVFLYWKSMIESKVNLDSSNNNEDLIFYDIFSESPRVCKFHDKKLRDAFNKGLELIHQNGMYEKILKKYTDYQTNLEN